MFSGRLDDVNPPFLQDKDKEFIESYGGTVELVECADCGHEVDATKYYDMFQYLYANIAGSAVSSSSPLSTDLSSTWEDEGWLYKFDQREFIDEEDWSTT